MSLLPSLGSQLDPNDGKVLPSVEFLNLDLR